MVARSCYFTQRHLRTAPSPVLQVAITNVQINRLRDPLRRNAVVHANLGHQTRCLQISVHRLRGPQHLNERRMKATKPIVFAKTRATQPAIVTVPGLEWHFAQVRALRMHVQLCAALPDIEEFLPRVHHPRISSFGSIAQLIRSANRLGHGCRTQRPLEVLVLNCAGSSQRDS